MIIVIIIIIVLSFIIISLHMATIPPRQTSALSTSERSEIPHSAQCVPARPGRPGWDETTEENMRIHHQWNINYHMGVP